MPGVKSKDNEVPAETSETFGSEHCAEEGPYDFSCIEKYGYLAKHTCPLDQESLFTKKVVKSEQTKTLSYQLSWIKGKWSQNPK